MTQHDTYTVKQFASLAGVTVRTLQFYDRQGLLAPSLRTAAGHRLYRREDLLPLQQILALKFLGFSLHEIQVYLRNGARSLQEALAQQRMMMQEKRAQLDAIIQAIEKTEQVLQDHQCDWESIIRVIEVVQTEQKSTWYSQHFTPEQLEKMEDLSAQSYSEEARQNIAERGKHWTGEDQQRANKQWAEVTVELKRLVAAGKSPTSSEAQACAQRWNELITQFSGGNQEIEDGLKRWWNAYHAMPEREQPLRQLPSYSREETRFLGEAIKHYRQNARV